VDDGLRVVRKLLEIDALPSAPNSALMSSLVFLLFVSCGVAAGYLLGELP
jgi:hypothetical protein